MTKLTALTGACLFMCFNVSAQKTNQKMTKEQKNVLKVIDRMTASFQNKDIDEVMACYTPDALVVFEPEKPVSDPNVLREMFQAMTMVNPNFTYGDHEVFVTGNFAMHITPWAMIGKMPDGTEIQQSGLSVAVLQKQKDGRWLMIFDNPHAQFLMNK